MLGALLTLTQEAQGSNDLSRSTNAGANESSFLLGFNLSGRDPKNFSQEPRGN